MSETEHWKGKLKPTGKTVEEYLGRTEFPSWCDPDDPENLKELFYDEYYDQAIEIKGIVYEVERSPQEPYVDIFDAEVNSDGTIDFEIKYYNGSCGFSEAIEHATKNLDIKTPEEEMESRIAAMKFFPEVSSVLGYASAFHEVKKLIDSNVEIEDDEILVCAFDWQDSPQGYQFWEGVFDAGH